VSNDLAAVEYVSSSVLSFLLVSQNRVKEKDGKVSLVGASELVKQVFEMASLDSLFQFCERLQGLGISLPPPKAQAKGREKPPRKDKVVTLKEAKPGVSIEEEPTPPPQGAPVPKREQSLAADGRERREVREVERIQPAVERRTWRAYGAWIGIAAVAAASL